MSRVRSPTIQKSRRDPGFTPTEKATRERLMKQFCRLEGSTNSAAYRNAPCWCACGRLRDGGKKCARCLAGAK